MYKFLKILVVLFTVFGLVACGENTTTNNANNNSFTENNTSAENNDQSGNVGNKYFDLGEDVLFNYCIVTLPQSAKYSKENMNCFYFPFTTKEGKNIDAIVTCSRVLNEDELQTLEDVFECCDSGVRNTLLMYCYMNDTFEYDYKSQKTSMLNKEAINNYGTISNSPDDAMNFSFIGTFGDREKMYVGVSTFSREVDTDELTYIAQEISKCLNFDKE